MSKSEVSVKIEDLKGRALDWAIFNLVGWNYARDHDRKGPIPAYSTDYSLGMPMIEDMMKNGMQIRTIEKNYRNALPIFKATFDNWETCVRGSSLMITAFRAQTAYGYDKVLITEIDVPLEYYNGSA